jgi:hypothetical protein
MYFREFVLLTEAKQNIIHLGFPPIVATLFNEKFGKNAYLVARWFKQHHDRDGWGSSAGEPDWWIRGRGEIGEKKEGVSLAGLTKIYEASFDVAQFVQAFQELGLAVPPNVDEEFLIKQRPGLREKLSKALFSVMFFTRYPIMIDLLNKTLTDVAAYKRLEFDKAADKYEKKKIFNILKPIKVYPDGFKWINVGSKCPFVGHEMRNCGSSGLMSWDNDRTLIVLFGPENKPHVIVTYSPNEKRISGDEGGGSTEVKEKYHDYILDLADTLNVKFDYSKTRSVLLKVKYLLRGKATGLEMVETGLFDKIFKFFFGGRWYYSDEYTAVAAEEIDKIQDAIQRGTFKMPNTSYTHPVGRVFNHLNKDALRRLGVNYIPLLDLIAS